MVNHPVYRTFVTFCVCCLLIVMFVSPTPASEAADLAFICKFNPITTQKPQDVIRFNPQETAELKLVATGLIRLYQQFVSSQDGPACNFQPTCSHFGMGCIQKSGMVRGIFLAADQVAPVQRIAIKVLS